MLQHVQQDMDTAGSNLPLQKEARINNSLLVIPQQLPTLTQIVDEAPFGPLEERIAWEKLLSVIIIITILYETFAQTTTRMSDAMR